MEAFTCDSGEMFGGWVVPEGWTLRVCVDYDDSPSSVDDMIDGGRYRSAGEPYMIRVERARWSGRAISPRGPNRGRMFKIHGERRGRLSDDWWLYAPTCYTDAQARDLRDYVQRYANGDVSTLYVVVTLTGPGGATWTDAIWGVETEGGADGPDVSSAAADLLSGADLGRAILDRKAKIRADLEALDALPPLPDREGV